MQKRTLKVFLAFAIIVPGIVVSCLACISSASNNIPQDKKIVGITYATPDALIDTTDVPDCEEQPLSLPTESEKTESKYEKLSKEEIDLIALVTMAEAEGECEEGKRLVIDTILNRVDHERFPNTVHDVIYQPNQFTPMWNGRIERCEVRDDIVQLVLEELECRTNYDVIFFTAGSYSKYGVPLFQVEHHYFSSYD